MCKGVPAVVKNILPDETFDMDMNGDPGSVATGTRSNRGTQCDMTPVMRCSAQQHRAGFTVCRQ